MEALLFKLKNLLNIIPSHIRKLIIQLRMILLLHGNVVQYLLADIFLSLGFHI